MTKTKRIPPPNTAIFPLVGAIINGQMSTNQKKTGIGEGESSGRSKSTQWPVSYGHHPPGLLMVSPRGTAKQNQFEQHFHLPFPPPTHVAVFCCILLYSFAFTRIALYYFGHMTVTDTECHLFALLLHTCASIRLNTQLHN